MFAKQSLQTRSFCAFEISDFDAPKIKDFQGLQKFKEFLRVSQP
jgi:hypothetical protein